MRKNLLFCLMILPVIFIAFTGCTQGINPQELVGWWTHEQVLSGVIETPPFYYIEIKEDNSAIVYDENGNTNGLASLVEGDTLYLVINSGVEYDVTTTNLEEINYLKITGEYHYRFSTEEPEIIGSNYAPVDPMEGSDGKWEFDAQSTDKPAPYAYLEVSEQYMKTYDAHGNLIDEEYIDYDEQRGLVGNHFMLYGDLVVDFGAYSDGLRYFTLSDAESWDDGYSWDYKIIEEFPFAE